jgi:hypothetical protein
MEITGIWLRRIGIIVEIDGRHLGLLCDDGRIRMIDSPRLRLDIERRRRVCINNRWYDQPVPRRA